MRTIKDICLDKFEPGDYVTYERWGEMMVECCAESQRAAFERAIAAVSDVFTASQAGKQVKAWCLSAIRELKPK